MVTVACEDAPALLKQPGAWPILGLGAEIISALCPSFKTGDSMQRPRKFKNFLFDLKALKWLHYTPATNNSTLVIGIDGQKVTFVGDDADELWKLFNEKFDSPSTITDE